MVSRFLGPGGQFRWNGARVKKLIGDAGPGVQFRWNGARVKKLIGDASREALEETAARCVAHAYPNTPFLTTAARGSLRYFPAQYDPSRGWYVDWGSFGINYYIYLEVGSRGRLGGYMLRNAADTEYPKLQQRIRNRVRGRL